MHGAIQKADLGRLVRSARVDPRRQARVTALLGVAAVGVAVSRDAGGWHVPSTGGVVALALVVVVAYFFVRPRLYVRVHQRGLRSGRREWPDVTWERIQRVHVVRPLGEDLLQLDTVDGRIGMRFPRSLGKDGEFVRAVAGAAGEEHPLTRVLREEAAAHQKQLQRAELGPRHASFYAGSRAADGVVAGLLLAPITAFVALFVCLFTNSIASFGMVFLLVMLLFGAATAWAIAAGWHVRIHEAGVTDGHVRLRWENIAKVRWPQDGLSLALTGDQGEVLSVAGDVAARDTFLSALRECAGETHPLLTSAPLPELESDVQTAHAGAAGHKVAHCRDPQSTGDWDALRLMQRIVDELEVAQYQATEPARQTDTWVVSTASGVTIRLLPTPDSGWSVVVAPRRMGLVDRILRRQRYEADRAVAERVTEVVATVLPRYFDSVTWGAG